MRRRKTVIITLLALLLVATLEAQLPVDLTTQLTKFLVDLRAGTLGVNQIISTITTTSNIASGGSVVAGASGTMSFVGREFWSSTANGILRIAQNSGASPILEINTGTAVPTVTSCGTGAVTTKSTNTAGEVTATGVTTCTLTFGAPAFTNQPFCAIEEETTLAASRISAISTTAFTVTGLTSGDKFMYICLGGQ